MIGWVVIFVDIIFGVRVFGVKVLVVIVGKAIKFVVFIMEVIIVLSAIVIVGIEEK